MTRITHKTAVLAKEKGYNELHKHYSIVAGNSTGEINKGRFGIRNSDSDMMVTRPRQSELQKWLRAKQTDITVITNWVKGGRVYYVGISYVIDNKLDIWFSRNDNGSQFEYATYEDALEVGLFQALSLIPAEIK